MFYNLIIRLVRFIQIKYNFVLPIIFYESASNNYLFYNDDDSHDYKSYIMRLKY